MGAELLSVNVSIIYPLKKQSPSSIPFPHAQMHQSSMKQAKRLGVFVLLPKWDAGPLHLTALNSPVPIHTSGWREAL